MLNSWMPNSKALGASSHSGDGPPVDDTNIMDSIELLEGTRFGYSMHPVLRTRLSDPIKTFYNPQAESADVMRSRLTPRERLAVAQHLKAEAAHSVQLQDAAALWLRMRVAGEWVSLAHLEASALIAAMLGDVGLYAVSETLLLQGAYAGTVDPRISLAIADRIAAELVPEFTLSISVEDTLAAAADDHAQAVGRYISTVNDLAGMYVSFKTSGDLVQGWVMNAEGHKPFSSYTEYEFNSFARIGNKYYAASDEGLTLLEGATDNGEDIAASVRTMMLDFGSTQQKRVTAAYLGYTSTGQLVLKVRAVEQGVLVENWYEARETATDAPDAGRVTLGRGLRSRYWQFELVNVDGADFEIDKLEVVPLNLSRRV